MRRLLAAGLGAALIAIASAGPAPAASDVTLSDIEDEVMCITCGTALSLSEAPLAQRQRAFIQRLIDRGLTKDQIKARLVEEFGTAVLATPPRSGFSLAAYLVPPAVLLLAVAGLLVGLRRRRDGARPPDVPARDDFEALVDADLARR